MAHVALNINYHAEKLRYSITEKISQVSMNINEKK